MRVAQELVENAKFVHQFQGRRMNGVAAKIAQEVSVLLEHHDLHSGASEKISGNHPRRSTPDYAAACVELLDWNRRICLLHRSTGPPTNHLNPRGYPPPLFRQSIQIIGLDWGGTCQSLQSKDFIGKVFNIKGLAVQFFDCLRLSKIDCSKTALVAPV